MVKSKSSDSLNYENNNNTEEGSGGPSGEETPEAEEGQNSDNLLAVLDNACEFSEAQELFRSQINSALRKLFSFLEIDYEASMSHR
jgi:hypothetical protein